MRDGATVDNWDDLCQPPIATRNGHQISDCFSGMVESIAEGVANAAKYLRYGQPRFAGDVLWNALSAQDEGAWCHKPVSFNKWIVLAALPIAYNCQEVSDALVSGQLEMLSNKVMKQNGGRPSGF